MALWEIDAFKAPQFLGFVRAAYEVTPPVFAGQRWVPNKTVDDLAFEYALGAIRQQVMATVLSFDAEAPMGQRAGAGERIVGELPPIKRKMRIGEKEIARFNRPRVGSRDQLAAVEQVYNDTLDLIYAVQSRIEWMTMQSLSEDLLVYNEDGIKFVFDYGINGDFQWNVVTGLDHHSRVGGAAADASIPTGGTWANPATATYINDLQQICDRIQRTTGQRPTEFVCSLKVKNLLLDSTEIKNLVRGTAAGTTTLRLSEDDVRSVFGRYNLPTIVTYDTTVGKENADGSIVTVRPMAENKAFLTQGRPVGNFLHGPTAESQILAGGPLSAAAPGVWANTYVQDEPPAQYVKVAAVAFPTLPEANRRGQMTL